MSNSHTEELDLDDEFLDSVAARGKGLSQIPYPTLLDLAIRGKDDSLDSSANYESLPRESYKDLHGRSDRHLAVRGNEGLKALREKKMELEQKRRIRINEFKNSKLSTKGNRK